MTVAICDDEILFRKQLKSFLIQFKNERRIHLDIYEFSDGVSLLEANQGFDIVFLDYQMPEFDGMKTARELRARKNVCSIIFITSFPEFMIKAFEVNTYRFLLKPLDTNELTKVLNNFIADKKMLSPIIINTEGEQLIICSEDIIYLEGAGKFCYVRTMDKIVRSSKTISAVFALLPQHCFFRTHKSYVINLYCIRAIKGNDIILNNGEKAKISRYKMTDFKNAYKTFIKNFISR